jgi:hypothetical protein
MRCYNHHEKDAVGLCRACGRGLCPSCTTEVEKAVACRDRCESDVSTILALNRNALQFAKSTRQARYLGPTLFMVLGLAFTFMGLTFDGMDFATWTGIVVFAIGVAFLIIQGRMAKGMKA